MENWFNLPDEDKKTIINQVSAKTGLLPTAIEKDWWVMIALKAIFSTEYSEYLVFKGGTSLSKAWGIIERFSEDIDLAIDRSYFNYGGILARKDVTKLRKASCKFVTNEFQQKVTIKLKELGVKDFEIKLIEFERSDTDPLAIELIYKSITDKVEYLKPRILIELSSRSLRDPFQNRDLISFIGKEYPELPFADKPIQIPSVLPTRTFLEKIFLLHEEFQKKPEKDIKSHRMTRHLYDISKIMDTPFLDEALEDTELYSTIVSHREMLTKISWVDYSKHSPETLNFIPPNSVIQDWENDYLDMQESMFYGETESFIDLIKKLTELNKKINSIKLK